jgi:RNA polymerase sigma-70 factor (ECF subfamily)
MPGPPLLTPRPSMARRPEARPLPAVRRSSILEESRRRSGASLFRVRSAPVRDMPDHPTSSATDLLARACAGDASALAAVFPLIYDELHRLARQQLRNEPDGHTLSATALLHEAYIRLIDYNRVQWTGRAHFMAMAATVMRRILVDHARSHRSLKRGGALRRVDIESIELATEDRAELLIALDDALDRLRELDARQAQVVECRFFGGLTEEETAHALGIGLRTVKRDWARAKGWLFREIYGDRAV